MISRRNYILSDPHYTVSDHKTNHQVHTDLKLIDRCNSHYIIPTASLVGFHITKLMFH